MTSQISREKASCILPAYIENCYAEIGPDAVLTSEGFRRVEHAAQDLGTLLITGTIYDNAMRLVDDAAVLRACKERGGRITREFTGDFAGVYLSPLDEAIVLSDRMCSRKIYIGALEKHLYIGTKMDTVALLEGKRELSTVAASLLMFEGSVTAPYTWYDGITCLRIGEYITWNRTTGELERHMSPAYEETHAESPELSPAVGRHIAACLEDSVLGLCNTLGREGLVMGLSAGWDTRMIEAILNKHHIVLPSFCIDTDHGYDEIQMASDIFSNWNVEIEGMLNDNDYFRRNNMECIQAMEYTLCEHVWYVAALDWLSHLGRINITGLGISNILRNNVDADTLALFESEDDDDTKARAYVDNRTREIDVLNREYFSELVTQFHNATSDSIAPFFHRSNGIKEWYLDLRLNSQIMRILDIVRKYCHCAQPFYSNPILDTCLQIPLRQCGPDAYRLILQAIDPQSWELPSSNDRNARKPYAPVPRRLTSWSTFDYMATAVLNGPLVDEGIVEGDILARAIHQQRDPKQPAVWDRASMMRLYVLSKRVEAVS